MKKEKIIAWTVGIISIVMAIVSIVIVSISVSALVRLVSEKQLYDSFWSTERAVAYIAVFRLFW